MELIEKEKEWEVTRDVPVTSTEERARRCREQLERAYKDMNTGFYDLAVGMAEAVEYGYPEVWGFRNIEEYADQVLGIERRKAYDIIACGRVLRLLPQITRERVEKIGWSKLAVVARRIELSPVNAEDYLELAENHSYRELRTLIAKLESAEALPPPGEELEAPFVLRNIKLDGEEAKIVQQAIELASNQLQTKNLAEAIIRICADWLLVQGETADLTLDHWLGFLQQHYGVRLTAVPETHGVAELSLMEDVITESPVVDIVAESEVSNKSVASILDDDDELEKLLS